MSSSQTPYPSTSQEWLGRLVSFDSISCNSNLALIECIEQSLAALSQTPGQPISMERIEDESGHKSNLLISIGPLVDGGVVLSGHTDVVPVEGQSWSSDPFELHERAGRLYARGSCDMKGFIACCLAQIPTWRTLDLKHPIYLALSYDEEVGCIGAPSMIKRLASRTVRPYIAIIGEPTMLKAVTQQKGITTLITTVKGAPAHSSQIPDGISAIHIAARLISHIEDIMRDISIDNAQCNHAYNVPYSTLHVGKVKGGTAVNIMAGECSFEWEIRDLPEQGFESIYARFESFVQKMEQDIQQVFPNASIATQKVVESVPGLQTQEDDPALHFLMPLLEDQTQSAVAFATEAGQFHGEGFSAVICGPGDIAQAHKADEFISLEQLAKGDELMRRIGEQLSQ